MKYCGMDLHSNNCVVIVSDEDDRLVLGKRVPNDLGQICGALEPHRDEMAGVVVESTLRHTHATQALAKGVSLTAVRDNLRHASISTTSVYLHTDELGRAAENVSRFRASGANWPEG